MTINTDNFEFPIYGLILIFGTIIGIVANTILNCMTLRCNNSKDIAISNALLCTICTFCAGSLFTLITSGLKSIGFSSIGGLIGMHIAYLVTSMMVCEKSDRASLLSNFMLVIPLIYGLTKIGCLFGGCCYGIEYSGVFNVEYLGDKAVETGALGIRFPVQLAESITFILLFIVYSFIRKLKHRDTMTQVLSLCVLCAIAKFMLDFLRASHIGQILSVNQVMCLVILVICAVAYIKKFKQSWHK